jgi:hypothetical protein
MERSFSVFASEEDRSYVVLIPPAEREADFYTAAVVTPPSITMV